MAAIAVSPALPASRLDLSANGQGGKQSTPDRPTLSPVEQNRRIAEGLKKLGVNRMMTPSNAWLTLSAQSIFVRNRGYLNLLGTEVLPDKECIEVGAYPTGVMQKAPLQIHFKPPSPGYYVVDVVCDPWGGKFFHQFASHANYRQETIVSSMYPGLTLVVHLTDTSKYEKLYLGSSVDIKFRYCTIRRLQ